MKATGFRSPKTNRPPMGRAVNDINVRELTLTSTTAGTNGASSRNRLCPEPLPKREH